MKAMRRAGWLTGVFTVAAFGMAASGRAADATTATNSANPLLDLLIKKGFVTQKEAETVQAEAEALRTNQMQMPPESKWKISSGIASVELFGDVKLRYEDRYAADSAGNSIDLQRYRYAVRLGLRGDLFDNFYYGVRLDTGVNPRSSFVTMGTSSPGSSVYQGPFGKSNSGINIGEAYLGWRPGNWLDLTVGKMPNPLYTTPLVWNGNITPEGFAETLKHTVGQADFFATMGQFIYQDLSPSSSSANLGFGSTGQNTDNIFLLAWQGGVKYHFTPGVSAKVAATLYTYVGLHQSTVNSFSSLSPYYGDPYIGEGAYYLNGSPGYPPGYSGYSTSGTPVGHLPGYGSVNYPLNQVGLNHLKVVEVPFEVDFPISDFDAKVFGDFAYNLDGEQRAQDAASAYQAVQTAQITPTPIPHTITAQTSDVKAYLIGFDLGSRGSLGMVSGNASKRHGWEIKTAWQHIEQYSLDPNLLDTDFFEGQENLEGIYVSAGYGLTDNLSAVFRYGHASRINGRLGTGGSGQDIPQINPISDYNIYQLDLILRF